MILKRIEDEESAALLGKIVLDDLLHDGIQALVCSRGGLIEPRTINLGHFENYLMEREWGEVSESRFLNVLMEKGRQMRESRTSRFLDVLMEKGANEGEQDIAIPGRSHGEREANEGEQLTFCQIDS